MPSGICCDDDGDASPAQLTGNPPAEPTQMEDWPRSTADENWTIIYTHGQIEALYFATHG